MRKEPILTFFITIFTLFGPIFFGINISYCQVPAPPNPFYRVATVPPPDENLGTANAITKDAITWTFNGTYTVGRFVTGDWYVVAPFGLSVTKISSSSGHTLAGSMKNPSPSSSQGYLADTGAMNYDISLNVGLYLPISLTPGDMLVSATKYNYYGVTNPSGEKNYTGIDQAAILTVLSIAPPSGSFRPGLCDLDRVIYNKSNIDYELMADLAPTASAPTLGTIENLVARPWLDHYRGWTGRVIHPHNNMRDYGAELTVDVGKIALTLNSDHTNSEKEPIAIGFIQMGLDFYSNIKRSKTFYQHTPFHIQGRKLPVLFAGYALDIAEIKAIFPYTGAYIHSTWGSYTTGSYVFAEDSAIYYVRQNDINATQGGAAQYTPDYDYTTAMIGMPEWFHHNYDFRWKGSSSWSTDPYRLMGASLEGIALAVHAMGLTKEWNNQAFFDYMDRYVAIGMGESDGYIVHGEKTGSLSVYGGGWALEMWNKYRKDY